MFNAIAGLRQPSAYMHPLESLRGWAILLVVAFHFFGILLGDRGRKSCLSGAESLGPATRVLRCSSC